MACKACEEHRPHRRSGVQCDVCGIQFAAGHVPHEENGMRICHQCRTKAAAHVAQPMF
ncbi:hypothetical protein QP986_08675 [Corynebacterium striatum]|uniref:hypothetical protein n=1 Tax=Corynebacterium striatum TaxID=43770 RepID=UPI00254D1CA3|nr:hypothetical protein [Corynebacterium striatum]MDK8844145.1 hypothetical protein [Corynebacterium striatum]